MKNYALFRVSYDGAALSNHEMDIKDLAPALLAVGELIEIANKQLNGDRVKVQINLKATDKGSVDVALLAVQNFWNNAVGLFDSSGVNAIVNAAEILALLGIGSAGGKGVMGLIRWMKNRPVKNVTRLEHGKVKIELEDGEARVIEEKELRLFSIVSIRKRIEAVVKPLSKDGVDKVTFSHKKSKNEIGKDEAKYFYAPEVGDELIDEGETELTLEILDLSFREGGKWRFSDGNSNFFAEIKDTEFLDRVRQNEAAFANDDLIKVVLLRKQYITDAGIKTEFVIKKVKEHVSSARQYRLPFNGKE